MALNKFMHPRNMYKVPPDFTRLAQCHPEFMAISKRDVTGKVTINFKDANTLRILTKCLLKSDFNLDVDIPQDRLVPTLPLRLNYILWLEDLLTAIERHDNIKGVDIGTGACAIYPLLAATKNKWNMVGTEMDPESYSKAEENIQKNNLQQFVTLKANNSKSIISHMFADEEKVIFDFCMCNPPFYSNIQELCESRSPARLPPKNGFTGSPQELITEGGELEFCRKLIRESKIYKSNFLIFTTMIGHKYNLNMLIDDLVRDGTKYTHTEFCQGRVTRWGLAWTYKDYDIHRLVPPRDKSRKKHTPTVHLLPELPNCTHNLDVVLSKIKVLLNNLSITHKLLDKRGNNVTLDVTAYTNTWTNLRRKRRLEKRTETEVKKSKPNNFAEEPKRDMSSESSNIAIDPPDDSEFNEQNVMSVKKELHIKESDHNETEISENMSNTQPILHAFLKLLKKQNILLELEFLDGSAGKEGLHQVMQYIKNNWK